MNKFLLLGKIYFRNNDPNDQIGTELGKKLQIGHQIILNECAKNHAFWQKIFGHLVRLAERKLFFPPLFQ